MSYLKAKERHESSVTVEQTTRTDYSCKAHGCLNAGSMAGDLCYHHWAAPFDTWHTVTQAIREDFDGMRNWGQVSPELQAKRRAESQRKFGQAGRKPMGLTTGVGA